MVPRLKSKAQMELTTELRKERMMAVDKQKRTEAKLFWKQKKKKKLVFSPKKEEPDREKCKTPELQERYSARLAERKNKISTSSVSSTTI
jgi:hypothetical protein